MSVETTTRLSGFIVLVPMLCSTAHANPGEPKVDVTDGVSWLQELDAPTCELRADLVGDDLEVWGSASAHLRLSRSSSTSMRRSRARVRSPGKCSRTWARSCSA